MTAVSFHFKAYFQKWHWIKSKNPNKKPTVLLRWTWAPSQPSVADFGNAVTPRPPKLTCAQLPASNVGDTFAERLPRYPPTAYVQKKHIQSIRVPWFTRCVLAIPDLTGQELVQLKSELQWAVTELPFLA